MRAVSAPENQTNRSRGGRSRAEGTKDVIAASGFAWSKEASGGVWKLGVKPGGAALLTQQAAQAAHLACGDAVVFESCLLQCSPALCSAA